MLLSGGVLSAQENTLRTLAEQQPREFYIGTAVSTPPLLDEPQYGETVRAQFNMLTVENALKMCAVQAERNVFNFNDADAAIQFAEANDMVVRGHTLVWYQCVPAWLENGTFSREEAIQILRDHIFTVVGRYKGRIHTWDVVNEAFREDGALRDTLWRRMIGDDYIEMAFRFAHEADPNARLFINDYDADGTNYKAQVIAELVEDLLTRGVPIHGVGLQMHIRAGHTSRFRTYSVESIRENIERFGALGLDVHITELDVKHAGTPTDDILALQALDYARILETCLTTTPCSAVVMWGFTDKHTWLREWYNPDTAPLLFDADYQPKPAYTAMIDVLTRAVAADS
jgi:endo-1,4-beta-xylanase